MLTEENSKKTKRQRFLLTIKGGQIVLELRELIYIERDKRNSILHCIGKESIVTTQDLDELLVLMEREDIIRCHNSYVINLNHIREVRRNGFVLKNGEEVPISRRYLEDVREKVSRWVEE